MDARKLQSLARKRRKEAEARALAPEAVGRHARDVQRTRKLHDAYAMQQQDDELPASIRERITTEYSNSLGLFRR